MFKRKKIVYVAVPERELSDITAEKMLLELKQDLNNFGSVLSPKKLGELEGKITGIEFMINNQKRAGRNKITTMREHGVDASASILTLHDVSNSDEGALVCECIEPLPMYEFPMCCDVCGRFLRQEQTNC